MGFKKNLSSPGGLEVEQWSDNRTLSISVDQSLLGACMITWYQWTRSVIYVLDVCYIRKTGLFFFIVYISQKAGAVTYFFLT